MPTPQQLKSLEWRCIGPFRAGRVVAVCGDPRDAGTFYHGACAGGVWKTTDSGITWRNVSDGFFKTSAVGAIACATSDPNILYVGTGETAIRGNVSHGDGVYKSTDAGATWTNVGLAETRHIARVRVHPTNPDIVYVAALGNAWGPGKDRGVYRSIDGGATWKQVLFKSPRAGAIDLSMDPRNPRILYATLWHAQRQPHRLDSGGADSAIYRTTDGGDTWTEITRNPGLPKGVLGKMGIAASGAQSGRVYAIVEAEDGALFRSDDFGATWTRLSEQGELRGRPWYYMHIYADPQDADTVYILDYTFQRSIDGGKSFSELPTPHGDNHDLWIDPANPRRMIEGNDGGACVSFNAGETWSTVYNQPTAQLYHVIADDQDPYFVYASQQDNTAVRLPSFSPKHAITVRDLTEPGGGESGYIAIKPGDPNIVFGGAIGSGAGSGRLIRWDARTEQERIVNVWPEFTGMAIGAEGLKYRFQWTFPMFFSRWDPTRLYIASNHIHVSVDEGAHWETLSKDLTRNDPSKLKPSGGPITLDNTSAECYCTIFALSESKLEKGVMWAGTDDGLVQLSRDGGITWADITPKGLPEWALISVIEPSAHDAGTAYLAATRYKLTDTKPYLFKTSDYGKTWKAITHGIPADEFTRVIREDPERRGLLFAGTETGVYLSLDDGESWERWNSNLPVCPVHDLVIKGTDLIAATHGRSIWILDDITPLRQTYERTVAAKAALLKPRDATRLKVYLGWGGPLPVPVNYGWAGPLVYTYEVKQTATGKLRRPLDAGHNGPQGALIHYWLKSEPKDDITLSVLDSAGNVLRSFSSKAQEGVKEEERDPVLPKAEGVNRFVWDLRVAPSTRLKEKKGGRGDYAVDGPVVSPGAYRLALTVGKQTFTQTLTVRADPRHTGASQADLDAQHAFLLKVRDTLSATHEAINKVRDWRAQAQAWKDRSPALKAQAEGLVTALTEIEDALIQVKSDDPRSFPARLNTKLGTLINFADNADFAPTSQLVETYDDLAARIKIQLDKIEALKGGALAAFNQAVKESGLDAVG
ncbi:MAG: hypothetical protein K1X39_09890 [Thermoflexales bacterium]|nr:hypothetical protein [Thermoflexales bacterium]